MKNLKYLFTVPKNEKVTEKHMMRVLVSSVCGILLCMTCLVSTTWAWFTGSITSEGNVIDIGQWEEPSVTDQETTESTEETTEATQVTTEATTEGTEPVETTEATEETTEETTETTEETTEAAEETTETTVSES